MEVNVLAVKRMMELCLNMKNLAAVVHVSTAYTHTDRYIVWARIFAFVMHVYRHRRELGEEGAYYI